MGLCFSFVFVITTAQENVYNPHHVGRYNTANICKCGWDLNVCAYHVSEPFQRHATLCIVQSTLRGENRGKFAETISSSVV